MINNSHRGCLPPAPLGGGWAAALTVLALAACDRHRDELAGYQGVVELEERDLAFEVSGRLAAVDVQPGARVEPTTVVARLDDALARAVLLARQNEADAALDQLRLLRAGARAEDVRALAARLEAARANEGLLQRNAERMRELSAAEAVTRAALDEAQSRLEQAQAERQALEENLRALNRGARQQEIQAAQHRLEAARAAVDLERERLERHVLVAGTTGEVLEVHLETSEMAPAGVPVVTVANVHQPYADVFVPQAEMGHIELGGRIEARVDGVPQAFVGRIETVGRRTEFTPRYLFSKGERSNLVVRVRVRLSDPEGRLPAGVPVFVEPHEGPP